MALNIKLKGKVPVGAYFESWACPYSNSAETLSLSKIPNTVNIVFLSFVVPSCKYVKGSNTFKGTGLNFTSNFQVVKKSIEILKARDCVVMLSVGGASSVFDTKTFKPQNVVNLALDLNVDGIDIDWEPSQGVLKDKEYGPIIDSFRKIYQGLLSTAAFSVGAYPKVNGSPYGGMAIQGLLSNGQQLDFINIMSYDAGNSYSPIDAFNAYRKIYSGPLLMGFEVPKEAWGGHVIKIDEIKKYAKFLKEQKSGMFVWAYHKNGTPNCMKIIDTFLL
jgi:GH18 family chitinase